MACQLSIERDPALTIEEWRAAVEVQPLLRYGSIDASATNPRTSEVVVIRGTEGDVAMELDGRWVNLFRWNKGRAIFNAKAIENPSHPVSKMVFSLAASL